MKTISMDYNEYVSEQKNLKEQIEAYKKLDEFIEEVTEYSSIIKNGKKQYTTTLSKEEILDRLTELRV